MSTLEVRDPATGEVLGTIPAGSQEAADRASFPFLYANSSITPLDVWVHAAARTPQQIKAEHAAIPHGPRPWWVVWIGREPGLYTTV